MLLLGFENWRASTGGSAYTVTVACLMLTYLLQRTVEKVLAQDTQHNVIIIIHEQSVNIYSVLHYPAKLCSSLIKVLFETLNC